MTGQLGSGAVVRHELSARERLIDAADLLMYHHGYEAVGVAGLCEQAAVRKGSFYYYFDSKQALALEMLDRAWARTKAELFLPTFGRAELDVLAAVDLYTRRLIAGLRSRTKAGAVPGCRFGNFAVELAARDAVIRERIGAIFAEMQVLVAGSIERTVAGGGLPAAVDASAAARNFVALMEGQMIMAKATGDPKELAALPDAVRRLLQPLPEERIA
jgi:TetR/AcrR family transcriptional repressor of nem operon